MQPSRRELIRLGVVAVAATGQLVVADRAFAATKSTRLARTTFTPNIGAAFGLTAAARTYKAVLHSVGDVAGYPAGDRYRFRLLFTVQEQGPDQGTYTFRSGSLGPLALFVVPVGGGRTYYEAIVVS